MSRAGRPCSRLANRTPGRWKDDLHCMRNTGQEPVRTGPLTVLRDFDLVLFPNMTEPPMDHPMKAIGVFASGPGVQMFGSELS
jgi:hypothetical protein